MLNTNIKASVLQSGFLSEFIDIEHGCRQGDPISSRMFIICAQVMLLLILNNKSIKGISVNGIEQIITQFADHTTLILVFGSRIKYTRNIWFNVRIENKYRQN